MTDPIAYLKDVGDTDDPCYVPAVKDDPGAFAVYAVPPKVHVIMGNDFPTAVVADEVEAQKACDDAMEEQRTKLRSEHPDWSEERIKAWGPRIYYRSYPFEVQ